ncbi:MAG: hypothetical protein WC522_03840 [Candidatus Omnitrophota bacterium]
MSDYSKLFEAILKESKNANGAFGQLLDSSINIPEGIRSTASDSHNHLREFLEGEHKRDSTFPRVLSIKDDDFLGGSFARHTKIWPLDDIDIYFPLDGFNLSYLQNGYRLPYTVVSDGVLSNNPLLGSRWTIGIYISSSKLVTEFAAVLKRHYPDTKVKPDGQSVAIRMTQGETSDEEGLGYDIVPCFSLQPDNKTESSFYLIPDGKDNWTRTNPRIDTEIAEKLHVANNKTYRKVVKIVKYWNKEKFRSILPSYYIELAIAKGYIQKNKEGENINSLSYGVAVGFWALNEAIKQGGQDSFLPLAPKVYPGQLDEGHKLIIGAAHSVSLQAWDAEKAGNQDQAISHWKRIFGDTFGA